MSRPTTGPDDPTATVPVRGRPLRPGNRWRIPPGHQTPVPARRTATPHQRPERPRQAAPAPRTAPPRPAAESLPALEPYRPCEGCEHERKRTADGTWAAAVVSLEMWDNGRRDGRYNVCNPHRRVLLAVTRLPGWRVVEYRT
jgi:hypothetical protein